MTRQAGKLLFVADGTGTSASPFAALTDTTITADGKVVDVTSRDDNGFQTLLAGAGVAKLTIKGNGILDDGTLAKALFDRVADQSLHPYTITWGGTHTLVGSFQMSQFEPKGSYDKEQNYSFQLESSGSITSTT